MVMRKKFVAPVLTAEAKLSTLTLGALHSGDPVSVAN